MPTAIGIDLGGTHIRVALVTKKGEILYQHKERVGDKRTQEDIVEHICVLVKKLETKCRKKASVIGIGVPGIVNCEKGIVYASPHFPLWKNFRLTELIQSQVNRPVIIDNDANMIAVGEKWKGSAREWKNFIMMTLGTGIGGALIIHSKLFRGDNGFTGEIGHMVIETEGPPCACGSRGCFEMYTSATGLLRMTQELVNSKTAPEIEKLKQILNKDPAELTPYLMQEAKQGNKVARSLYEKMGYYLGIGMASLINILGIQKILIGGGLTGASEFYLPKALQELKTRTYQETLKDTEVRLAQLGDNAGLLGSAKTAFEN